MAGSFTIRQSKTILARSLGTDSRLYHFVIAVWRAKEADSAQMKYWEIIANRLSNDFPSNSRIRDL